MFILYIPLNVIIIIHICNFINYILNIYINIYIYIYTFYKRNNSLHNSINTDHIDVYKCLIVCLHYVNIEIIVYIYSINIIIDIIWYDIILIYACIYIAFQWASNWILWLFDDNIFIYRYASPSLYVCLQ